MSLFGLELDFPRVSFLVFIVTLIVGLVLTIALAIYISTIRLFGKEMIPYQKARLTFGMLSIFQIYSIGNLLHFEFAKHELGGIFKSYHQVPIKTKFSNIPILSSIMGTQMKTTVKDAVLPRSVYSVDGVDTVLLFDLYPQLNPRLLADIKALLGNKCKNIGDAKAQIKDINDPVKRESLKDFIRVYEETAKKYSLTITVDDVVKFLEKNTSLTSTDAITKKVVNKERKKRKDNTIMNKVILIAFIWVIGLLILLGWVITHKPPTPP